MAEKCPHCGGSKFVTDYVQGSLICKTCGLVLEEKIVDTGPYWHAKKEEKRHTGPPVTVVAPDLGVSSRIDQRNRDAAGRKLLEQRIATFRKLRRVDRRARMTNSERTLFRVLQVQSRICYSLGLPNLVKERAAVLFRKVFKTRSLRGHSINAAAAATVYLACRELGIAREMDEVARECGIGVDRLRKTYSLIIRAVHVVPSQIEVICLLHGAVKRLGLSDDLCAAVVERLKGQKAFSRKDALEQIAVAIYKECQKRRKFITQTRIAEALEFSRIALSKAVRQV